MILDIITTVEIIEIMEIYKTKVRPRPEIRDQVDIGYEIQDQSVILQEIRPSWKNPSEIQQFAFAKTTYVKNKNNWKVFWQGADLKWHSYTPMPIVKQLTDFLNLVDQDKHHCFKG